MGERKIKFITSVGTFPGHLDPDQCPKTTEVIWKLLPIEGIVRRWGLEIYFDLNISPDATIPQENTREVVDFGDLGYWPTGKAFCVFFGPTPISKGTEIRPASAVNVFGKLEGNLTLLDNVKDGEDVKVIADE